MKQRKTIKKINLLRARIDIIQHNKLWKKKSRYSKRNIRGTFEIGTIHSAKFITVDNLNQ